MEGLTFAVRRVGLVVAAAIVLGAVGVYAHYGTVSPCGIIRQKARDAAAKEGGFVAVIGSALPDSVLDAIMRTQLGGVTPDRCLMALLKGESFGDETTKRAVPAPQSHSQPPQPHNRIQLDALIERPIRPASNPSPRPDGDGNDMSWATGKFGYLREYIGSYKTDEVLDDPQINSALDELMQAADKQILRDNLGTRGPIEFIGNSLIIQGLKPHEGGSEEAIVSIRLTDGVVNAAVLHNRHVSIYTQETAAVNLPPPIYSFAQQKSGSGQ